MSAKGGAEGMRLLEGWRLIEGFDLLKWGQTAEKSKWKTEHAS